MSHGKELRPLRQFAKLAPNHSSQLPATYQGPAKSPARGLSAGLGWRPGGYYTNSGLLNAYTSPHTKSSSSRRSTSISAADKSFHVNVELRDSFEVRSRYPSNSLITRSSVNYDPIFHTSRAAALPSTRLRLKGLGELLDRARTSNSKDTVLYREALQANPRAFCKQSGEFSKYTDNCVRASAGPFHR